MSAPTEPGGPRPERAAQGAERAAPLEAAGGLVWRAGWAGPRLALVHRPRYGDWTLPKGKREPGEDLCETARREVREETGCAAVLRAFAGRTRHEVAGRAKEVSYWHMELAGELDAPDSEVDAVAWLRRRDALARLTYPNERELLERAPPPAWLRPPWRRARLPRAERTALSAGIECLRLELACSADAPERGQLAREHLDRAAEQLTLGEGEAARRALEAAARHAVLGLSDAGLAARAEALRREAEAAVSGWRRAAIQELLARREPDVADGGWTRPGGALAPGPVAPERLFHALALRDDVAAERRAERARRRRRSRALLGLLLTSGLGLYALLASAGELLLSAAPADDGTHHALLLLGGLLAGLAGGATSALRDAGSAERGALSRPLVGGAAALLAFLLLRAPSPAEPWPPLVLLAAFAAGFAERLVTRAPGSPTRADERERP